MNDDNSIIRIFSGTEVLVIMLKAELEEAGIGAMIRNDFQSGVLAGFVAGIPSVVDLYIQESDLVAAESIINAFIKLNSE